MLEQREGCKPQTGKFALQYCNRKEGEGCFIPGLRSNGIQRLNSWNLGIYWLLDNNSLCRHPGSHFHSPSAVHSETFPLMSISP